MDTQMMLAPAAGAGIGRELAKLLLADPEFLPAMKDALLGGLKATMPLWDKEAKDWSDRPDYRTRTQTVVQIIAHMEGEPIRRILHQHLNDAATAADLVAAIQESPALAAELERTLDKAKFRTRHVKKAESVELPAE